LVSKVQWAEKWPQARIDAGRAQDRFAKAEYFRAAKDDAVKADPPAVKTPKDESMWQKVKHWWRS
jgi:hypothetical protein